MHTELHIYSKVMSDSQDRELLQAQLDRLRRLLQMEGPINEGRDGERGAFLGIGDTYESTTWPKGVKIVDDGEGEGVIYIPYDCMVRHKHYIAQVESATKDEQHPAIVSAKYAISRKGRLNIFDVKTEGHQARRCGNSIRERLQSLNGQIL